MCVVLGRFDASEPDASEHILHLGRSIMRGMHEQHAIVRAFALEIPSAAHLYGINATYATDDTGDRSA